MRRGGYFVPKDGQGLGGGVGEIGAELRGQETFYACGDGGVDDETLALETFVSDDRDDGVDLLGLEGAGDGVDRGEVYGEDGHAGGEGLVGCGAGED